MRLSPERIQDIRRRLEKAEEGPWHFDPFEGCVRRPDRAIVHDSSMWEHRYDNARFIAAARADVADLLDELESYRNRETGAEMTTESKPIGELAYDTAVEICRIIGNTDEEVEGSIRLAVRSALETAHRNGAEQMRTAAARTAFEHGEDWEATAIERDIRKLPLER